MEKNSRMKKILVILLLTISCASTDKVKERRYTITCFQEEKPVYERRKIKRRNFIKNKGLLIIREKKGVKIFAAKDCIIIIEDT